MNKKIRLVTIDNFYKNLYDSFAAEMFIEVLRIRSEGYGPDYPKSHLPLDSGDFVCRHHIFCLEKTNGKLEPISSFFSCDLSLYDFYHLQFPIMSLAYAAKISPHTEALEELLNRYRKNGFLMGYAGGFTIKKQFREDRELSKNLRELCVGLIYHDFVQYKMSGVIGVGVPRFKTNLLWEKSGFKPITWKGKELGTMPKITAEGEPLLVMCSEQMSAWAQECRAKHQEIINSRFLVPSDENSFDEGQIAA